MRFLNNWHTLNTGFWRLVTWALVASLVGGCASSNRLLHMYGSTALPARTQTFADGGQSVYYGFQLQGEGVDRTVRTQVFLIGGSGCPSWKSVLPDYVKGLRQPANVWAMNKRWVTDRSTGFWDCGHAFDRDNRPAHWLADQAAFIRARLAEAPPPVTRVMVVGVSEGAWVAGQLARDASLGVTHLVLIGSGAWSLRRNLEVLGVQWNGSDGGTKIQRSPHSLTERWWGHPHQWWSDVLDLDPLPGLLALDVPIWAAMGAEDTSVPVASVQALASSFADHGKPNLTVTVYPGANHLLQGATVDHRQALFSALSAWLEIPPESTAEVVRPAGPTTGTP